LWLLLFEPGWVPLALTEVPADTRRVVYPILANVAATMDGFTLTSISIMVNLQRTLMTGVDRASFPLTTSVASEVCSLLYCLGC
jgi:hypothetical protein